MFDYDQEVVKYLLQDSIEFQRLYDRHHRLKQQVEEAHRGDMTIDDFALERLKKEKLQLKDRMADLIANYRRNNVSASA
ncbi:uncharacterized protein YdcH (DUF465 family) [Methylohalomonas lacus]|uniref:Uncharacterized protein YdcH (DUF465 family) n=1 Tax=Methylohalomonas lacus TaxID=398773 RepID=A0AAE3L195_9GAMM|nr:YdcH family protein [Methylohalomonas lacus]MCS3903669.1 uncharacterized protein YdcH (DUF465 family) [Methylohalomonas lacus]